MSVAVSLTHKTGLLEGGNDARLGRGGDDSHWVALVVSPLQLLVRTWALHTASGQLLGDLVELTVDELVLLIFTHLEVMLLHESLDHPAEVHAHEVGEEAIDGVGLVDVVLLHDLVGKVGACFEGETLRLAESVVAVEEDILDLNK